VNNGPPRPEWDQPYDHSMAIMVVASRDPALAAILNHQHDCIEDLKTALGRVPTDMREIVRSEFQAVAEDREQTAGAFWRSARGWVTTIAAVAAAILSAFHH
jgi:anti-sigma-K factor RskA